MHSFWRRGAFYDARVWIEKNFHFHVRLLVLIKILAGEIITPSYALRKSRFERIIRLHYLPSCRCRTLVVVFASSSLRLSCEFFFQFSLGYVCVDHINCDNAQLAWDVLMNVVLNCLRWMIITVMLSSAACDTSRCCFCFMQNNTRDKTTRTTSCELRFRNEVASARAEYEFLVSHEKWEK